MLPFEEKSWAPSLAKAIIAGTLLLEVVAILSLRHYGPLDTAEITALILVLIAVIPPNVHVIRLRSRTSRLPNRPMTQPGSMR